MEGHLVTRLDDNSCAKTSCKYTWVKCWRNWTRHLSSWPENGTEVATDQSHVRDFGEEEIELVGNLLCTTLVSTEFFDFWRSDDVDSSVTSTSCCFTSCKHSDLDFTATTGRKTDFFLDTVGWILQIDILDGKGNVNRLYEFALWRVFDGLLDGGVDVFFHIVSPLQSARLSPLLRFVMFVQLKRSSHSPLLMISRASLAQ